MDLGTVFTMTMDSSSERTPPVSLLADVVVAGGLVLMAGAIHFLPRMAEGDEPASERRLLRIGLGILCLVAAWLWLSLRRAQRDLRRMDDLLTDVRFGAGTRRDRDAVDILIRALRTPDARARETALRTLRKISGFDLGEDPAPWEEWWRSARNSFVRSSPAPRKK